MEAITNGAEDFLIDGLSFKLPSSATYVTERRKVSYYATGSNIYKPNAGVKIVKFQLNGDDNTWLDPASVVFQFELKNTGAAGKDLVLIGPPATFFKRMRIISGSLIEDIQDFGRYMNMMISLQSEGARVDMQTQGFGRCLDDPAIAQFDDFFKVTEANPWNSISAAKKKLLAKVASQGGKVVNFRILSGLFNQPKYLPLRFLPLTIEFELGDQYDNIVEPRDYGGEHVEYTIANTSGEFEIYNCRILCDVVSLDNSLNNEYTSHLLAGKSLPITYSTFISQQSYVSGTQFAVQIIRAVSRLQKVFLSLYSNSYATNEAPYAKPSFIFFHPMHENRSGYAPADELEISMQLGNVRVPEQPCQSLAEAFYHLKQALNLPDHHQHSLGIRLKQYRQDKFIAGFSFERVSDAAYTAINTKAGQILLVNMKAISPASIATGKIADVLFSVLQVEQILEIRDQGITIYD